MPGVNKLSRTRVEAASGAVSPVRLRSWTTGRRLFAGRATSSAKAKDTDGLYIATFLRDDAPGMGTRVLAPSVEA